MNLSDIEKICKKLKGVTQDIKWEEHLCFNVGGKMFLITSPDAFPVTASFKTNNEDFEILAARQGFKPAPYLAKYKWIHTSDIALLSANEWEYYLKQSYTLIAEKLPKKLKPK